MQDITAGKEFRLRSISKRLACAYQFWCEIANTIIMRRAEGQMQGIMSRIRLDITARKEAEAQRDALLQALRRSEGQLKAQLDNSPNSILTIDRSLKFRRLTAPFRDIKAGRIIIGQDAVLALPPSARGAARSALEACFTSSRKILDFERESQITVGSAPHHLPSFQNNTLAGYGDLHRHHRTQAGRKRAAPQRRAFPPAGGERA